MKEMIDAIPSSWLDPLLTGPNAVIGKPPYTGKDIEALLNGLRERLKNIAYQPTDAPDAHSNCHVCQSEHPEFYLCIDCANKLPRR